MKILLLQSPMPQNLMLKQILDFGLRYMPLQLGYIASVLRENQYEVDIIDLHVTEMSPQDFADSYLRNYFSYDIVGISCTTVSFNNALKIAELVKKYNQHIKTIIGGPHVTFKSIETLQENEFVDFVVRGEGEYTMLELVQALEARDSFHKINGLTFRDESNIICNPDRSPLKNLDILPFPARDLFLQDKYPNQAIVTSRGCPRKCIFCSAGAMSNYSYRIRSPQNIVQELSQLQGEQVISLYDNTFSGHYDMALAICDAIIQAKLNISWTCELRVDRATPELFKKLYLAGCCGVQFGVESGSDKVLRSIKKGITVSQVREAVNMALDAKLVVVCSFTLGHPSDTPESIETTFEFMKELRQKGVTVASALLVPYPGTDLAEKSQELGVKIHDFNWDSYYPARPIISTEQLSREQLAQYYMHSKLVIEDPEFVNLRLAL